MSGKVSKEKGDAPSAANNSKPVKTSRIKKMMKGLTRKKKKSSAASVSDAMSTAVSVLPDEMSAMSVPTSSGSKPKPVVLQLVLLLMDPNTRRFELLQLEFDSDNARVSDIMAQIPLSVTEESIRSQEYDGVLDASGIIMNGYARLVDFCTERTVLVAQPKGLTAKECNRLARPILCDGQVEKMVSIHILKSFPLQSLNFLRKPLFSENYHRLLTLLENTFCSIFSFLLVNSTFLDGKRRAARRNHFPSPQKGSPAPGNRKRRPKRKSLASRASLQPSYCSRSFPFFYRQLIPFYPALFEWAFHSSLEHGRASAVCLDSFHRRRWMNMTYFQSAQTPTWRSMVMVPSVFEMLPRNLMF